MIKRKIYLLIGPLILLAFLASLTFFWVKPLWGDAYLSPSSNNLIIATEESSEEVVGNNFKLLAFGDLMLDRNVGTKIKNNQLQPLLGELEKSQIFSDRDIILANLEGAVTNAGAHYAPRNAYDFAFPPETIAQLQHYGFNFFNLANNHFSDQGEKGVLETRANLTTLGFDYSGSVDAKVDDYSVKVKEINGQEIVFLGLSMVYNHFDLAAAQEIIKSQKEQGRLVIVNIHWGNEYQHQFNSIQQGIGYGLVDSGADLIIGHHPHVIQGMEIYHGRPIFYSLGNFIFDQYFSAPTQQGLALSVDYQSGSWRLKLIPLQSKASVPRMMTTAEANIFWPKFLSWSKISSKQQSDLASDGLELNF